ncbi:hypothetical protein AB0I98_40170 [Streptomyces sp. NPDC050211]|uniref:hypothetical protein n=1 Tax=Streptomyces sp. NPDC050211 TaxID=3154932 RepID=UPI00341E027D
MKLIRLPFILAVALAALLGTLASPASATERTCFGNTGNFSDRYWLSMAHWEYGQGAKECFGVSPSGTIWHTWESTDKWHEMPGNGRAEEIWNLYDVLNSSQTSWIGKAVKVRTEADNYYCSYLDYATNTWGGWYASSSSSTAKCTSYPNSYGIETKSYFIE